VALGEQSFQVSFATYHIPQSLADHSSAAITTIWAFTAFMSTEHSALPPQNIFAF
jgi:hypothetical protein